MTRIAKKKNRKRRNKGWPHWWYVPLAAGALSIGSFALLQHGGQGAHETGAATAAAAGRRMATAVSAQRSSAGEQAGQVERFTVVLPPWVDPELSTSDNAGSGSEDAVPVASDVLASGLTPGLASIADPSSPAPGAGAPLSGVTQALGIGGPVGSTPIVLVVAPGPASAAGLSWPLSGTITSFFGPAHPLGIDIATNAGAAIVSAGDGRVALTGYDEGYGHFVVINHPNGYTTLYAHLMDPALVQAGDVVPRGQLVGYAGSTGRSSGPHLHFEVRRYNDLIDPLHVLLGGPPALPSAPVSSSGPMTSVAPAPSAEPTGPSRAASSATQEPSATREPSPAPPPTASEATPPPAGEEMTGRAGTPSAPASATTAPATETTNQAQRSAGTVSAPSPAQTGSTATQTASATRPPSPTPTAAATAAPSAARAAATTSTPATTTATATATRPAATATPKPSPTPTPPPPVAAASSGFRTGEAANPTSSPTRAPASPTAEATPRPPSGGAGERLVAPPTPATGRSGSPSSGGTFR